MSLQLDLWQLITLLGGMSAFFIGSIAAMSKMMVGQFEKHLDDRFAAQEELRREGRAKSEQRFDRLEQANIDREREMLKLRAELPVHYVRREDAIRAETVINAKLDAL